MPDLNSITLPDPPTTAELVESGEIDAADDWNTYPSPSLPMGVARRLVADLFTTNGHKTLVFWRGDWWIWEGPAWRQVEDDLDVKEYLWNRLEEVIYFQKDDKKAWAPTTAKIHNLMEPLAIRSKLAGSVDAPAWLDDTQQPKATQIVSLRNGLLDLDTQNMAPHTPTYFNSWALSFEYDPNAQCPVWENFLSEVFAHDPAGAQLLQEYAGYLISGRMDHHKAMLLIGPARGGKGVISRTLKQLVGVNNTVSPSLHSMGSEFGMADLIGKPLAIVEDARADDDRRNNATVERLLNIIGEDAVSINRKNIDFWNGTLPTRFLLVSNEMPRFLDSSGAINTRFMSVKLRRSFADDPDTTLGSRINQELPGVFNWALAGLDRLDQQGHFTRPETMDEIQDLMGDMSSPASKFLDENYIITGDEGDHIRVSEVHGKYKVWCEDQEMKPSNRDTLVQRLVAADSSVWFKNTSVDGGPKTRWLFGLKVKGW